jgi:hypothetical protein
LPGRSKKHNARIRRKLQSVQFYPRGPRTANDMPSGSRINPDDGIDMQISSGL